MKKNASLYAIQIYGFAFYISAEDLNWYYDILVFSFEWDTQHNAQNFQNLMS